MTNLQVTAVRNRPENPANAGWKIDVRSAENGDVVSSHLLLDSLNVPFPEQDRILFALPSSLRVDPSSLSRGTDGSYMWSRASND